MVMQHAPKLILSHGPIESVATYRTMPCEQNPETSDMTPTHWANERIFILKQVEEAVTLHHHKLHSFHNDTQTGGNSELPASP